MDFSQAIIKATCDLFETMIMLEARPGEARTEIDPRFSDSVTGMLGFSGDLRGMLKIHCPSPVAKAVTEALLGMPVEEVDEEVHDTIGEITNMVAGGLKVIFSGEERCISLSIPTTIGGRSYKVHSLANAERVVVPFAISGREMLVEIQFVGF